MMSYRLYAILVSIFVGKGCAVEVVVTGKESPI